MLKKPKKRSAASSEAAEVKSQVSFFYEVTSVMLAFLRTGPPNIRTLSHRRKTFPSSNPSVENHRNSRPPLQASSCFLGISCPTFFLLHSFRDVFSRDKKRFGSSSFVQLSFRWTSWAISLARRGKLSAISRSQDTGVWIKVNWFNLPLNTPQQRSWRLRVPGQSVYLRLHHRRCKKAARWAWRVRSN